MSKQATVLGLLLIAACDATAPQSDDVCVEAQQHVDACGLAVELPAECDTEGANAILDADCEDLSDAGKADGCNPWFWWTCVGDGEDDEGLASVAVSIDECGDYFGVVDCSVVMSPGSCIEVVVRDERGDVVGSDLTSVHGSARIDGLVPGAYTVEVLTRDGEVAPMIDGDVFSSSGEESPARVEVSLAADDAPVLDVYMKSGTGESLQRCADARLEVEGSCDGDTELTVDETEWSWFVTFERQDTGEQVDITRPFVRWVEELQTQTNFAYGNDLPAGRYAANVHLMDIPSWRQENNPDYDELLERYSEGVVQTVEFEVAPSDALQTLDLGTIALDRACGW